MKTSIVILILGFSTAAFAHHDHDCGVDPQPTDYCRIRPLWQGEEFEGFAVMVRRETWQKFLIKDYGNHREIAYRRAREEIAAIRFDGLCE